MVKQLSYQGVFALGCYSIVFLISCSQQSKTSESTSSPKTPLVTPSEVQQVAKETEECKARSNVIPVGYYVTVNRDVAQYAVTKPTQAILVPSDHGSIYQCADGNRLYIGTFKNAKTTGSVVSADFHRQRITNLNPATIPACLDYNDGFAGLGGTVKLGENEFTHFDDIYGGTYKKQEGSLPTLEQFIKSCNY